MFYQSTRINKHGAGIVCSLCFTLFHMFHNYMFHNYMFHFSHASATHHWLAAEVFQSGAVKKIECPVSGSDVAWWRIIHEISDLHSGISELELAIQINTNSTGMILFSSFTYMYIFIVLCRLKASCDSGIRCIFRTRCIFIGPHCGWQERFGKISKYMIGLYWII